ncbi:toll/interleukin-1 receptor domain-containing protein [Denitromonas halophila]|uniref:Toll/interleukin-1 receptor domain-containing protein n=1 Tax=Denitromonas halophila TaxID=1629404 RepID=A0A558EM95_9RHOO|nr:toll/interleukin-1 receptor domain-containing protein [Denitromonas halophila]TVO51995.1 toll/interleukin-1 receptor domain-containing protein [Denitromonas halophila]TVT45555.1 MAG: toll/interleukin-1 receptor domain-containing protein [Denitromonas halophila]TVT74461.1 MAG: toll/interleukin-1 receptor domain-containing protein [Denitromonas halophila]
MGDFRPASLFVSYSHLDSKVVLPLIEMNEDFQQAAWIDYLHTNPGSVWSEEHRSAISKCYRLVLLWTANSANSNFVEKEWRYALDCGTPIIPVLLDQTPLPPELSSIHAVSLREYVQVKKGNAYWQRSPPIEWMGLGSRWDWLGATATLIIIAVCCIGSYVAITNESTFIAILGWGSVPFLLALTVFPVLNLRIEFCRAKLRHRLRRLVVQSLKEWGSEQRLNAK